MPNCVLPAAICRIPDSTLDFPARSGIAFCGGGPAEELAMRRIIEANIKRLKEMLKVETDPTKRAMEERILAEEEEKLKEVKPGDRKAF
jgi:hypothetical protein